MLVEKYGWAIQKSLFAETNQDSTFSHTRENSKMFNKTSNILAFLTINHLQAESRYSCLLFYRYAHASFKCSYYFIKNPNYL